MTNSGGKQMSKVQRVIAANAVDGMADARFALSIATALFYILDNSEDHDVRVTRVIATQAARPIRVNGSLVTGEVL